MPYKKPNFNELVEIIKTSNNEEKIIKTAKEMIHRTCECGVFDCKCYMKNNFMLFFDILKPELGCNIEENNFETDIASVMKFYWKHLYRGGAKYDKYELVIFCWRIVEKLKNAKLPKELKEWSNDPYERCSDCGEFLGSNKKCDC
jgi:hypothetical protein